VLVLTLVLQAVQALPQQLALRLTGSARHHRRTLQEASRQGHIQGEKHAGT
jgi:hypothetical protein